MSCLINPHILISIHGYIEEYDSDFGMMKMLSLSIGINKIVFIFQENIEKSCIPYIYIQKSHPKVSGTMTLINKWYR